MTLSDEGRRRIRGVVAALGLALAASIVPSAANAQWATELANAPQRFESQDRSAWVHPIIPKAHKTRAEVVQLYHNKYVVGDGVSLTWSGSIASCMPGTTNVEHQQAVIGRVNYFRELVDLPGVALSNGTNTAEMQAAALMMSANNALDHFPPMGWNCYSAQGANGAASSNLAIGVNGVKAVDLFVDDPGPGNSAGGHRRWVLFPPRTGMTSGDVPGGNMPPRPANALHVFGTQGPRPATPNGIAWPPAGFVPYQNLPSSNRWSFSFPGAIFTTATVAVVGSSGNLPVTIEPIATGFGDNTIVFIPAGIPTTAPATDTTYSVIVSNVGGTGVPSSFNYNVTIIDPGAAPPALPTAEAVEYHNAALDHYFITHLAAEIAILDAGVAIRGWNRTGHTFKVFAAAGTSTSPVCRFYIPPGLGDSHFYGRGTAECDSTASNNPSFVNEDPRFFHVMLPTAGNCPAGTVEIYRVFSNRPDANHRYMVSRPLRAQMVARGWLVEGDGPNAVVMCGPA